MAGKCQNEACEILGTSRSRLRRLIHDYGRIGPGCVVDDPDPESEEICNNFLDLLFLRNLYSSKIM